MKTLTRCPICDSSQVSPYLTCKDYLVSFEDFAIQQCDACKFRFTNPRPDETTIGSYYKSEQYISHNDVSNGIMETAYRTVRSYTLKSKLRLINELNNGTGSILDVGCGTGTFLETCKAGGWSVAGVEPDSEARAISAQRLQIAIKPNIDDLATENSFDVVSLWHVLEHIPELNEAVSQLHNLVSKEGVVLIAVPNSDSYDAMYFKEYWAAYDVPRHLHHFVPSTIELLFENHGFRLVGQKPMRFDAFYIAMLSTRYQTGKTDYLKSIQMGLASNSRANRSGNYSSVMYLFKK